MSINQDERPRFYEGQYLGAEDLAASVEYGRIQQARHLLGGHTWGIAMGLQLREADSPWGGGNVDVFIQPGYAWDGFGRPVVVLAPYKLSVDLFKDQHDGLVPVWLRYAETKTREPRPGFGVCNTEDQTLRIQETFAVAVGDFSHSEQHDEVAVSGKSCDAREVYRTIQSKEVLICDESVPFQTFPDIGSQEGIVCQETELFNTEPQKIITARWLVPLGYVRWKQGAGGGPGSFDKLFDPKEIDEVKKRKSADLKASRSMRQYAGTVSENIYSADGVIRLRNRESMAAPGPCNEERLKVDDTSIDRDMSVDEKNGLLSMTDLVWIEGNLRAKGDIKLFGKKIDFRNSDGSENKAPLCIQRREDNKLIDDDKNTGKDLQLVLGNTGKGKNRLTIGPLEGNTLSEKVVIQDDGKVGIQTNTPKNALDVKGKVVIGTSYAGQVDALENGLLVEGNVGIKTSTPKNLLDVNGSAVIGVSYAGVKKAPENGFLVEGGVGIGTDKPDGCLTIRGAVQPQQGSLTIFSKDSDFVYDGGNDKLFYFKNTSPKGITAFVGGLIGIGSDTPRSPLSIRSAEQWEELISFEDATGKTTWHLNQKPPNLTPGLNFAETGKADGRLFLQAGGNVGIGTMSPAEKLDVRGHIKMHTDGSLYALGGVENLRVIVGHVSTNGGTLSGQGFTSARNGSGSYSISFSLPFSSAPVVVVSPVNGSDNDNLFTIRVLSASGFQLIAKDVTPSSEGNVQDTEFTFIVMGPRT